MQLVLILVISKIQQHLLRSLFRYILMRWHQLHFSLLGIYTDQELLNQIVIELSSQKLDMGKGCIRFKKMDQIPFDLNAELVQKISVEEWINC
ncbi:DUF1801 domain-containing protein [Flavobacterium urumqiense]|uniref:DUF1801 domain-containing protein n=1 Tax=Flavobacterium urumqiense TaxID=935224 RepID=UPI001ABF282E|nr:DUF1801 domain-containing protein [Flavobacterium urumqiense]